MATVQPIKRVNEKEKREGESVTDQGNVSDSQS